MMYAPRFLRMLAFGWLLSPLPAFAQRTLIVATGTRATFWEIMNRIISYAAGAISTIALVMFVVGAFMITISGAKEDYRQTGKNLMIGAVLSMAVVLGAYSILRTVDYFLTA